MCSELFFRQSKNYFSSSHKKFIFENPFADSKKFLQKKMVQSIGNDLKVKETVFETSKTIWDHFHTFWDEFYSKSHPFFSKENSYQMVDFWENPKNQFFIRATLQGDMIMIHACECHSFKAFETIS